MQHAILSSLRTYLSGSAGSVCRKPGALSPPVTIPYISLSSSGSRFSSLCSPCLAKVCKALQQSGKVELRSMCSRVGQTWVQVSHPLCSNERLPRRFWKGISFSGLSPPESLCDSDSHWDAVLAFVHSKCYFRPLVASFCPGQESKAARRLLILLPHLWCPAASRHSRLL